MTMTQSDVNTYMNKYWGKREILVSPYDIHITGRANYRNNAIAQHKVISSAYAELITYPNDPKFYLYHVHNLDKLNWTINTDLSNTFKGEAHLQELDFSGITWPQNGLTNVSCLFQGCSELQTVDITGLDTSSIVDFTGLFDGCSSLTSLGNVTFDLSSITAASQVKDMFNSCTALGTNRVTLKFSNVDSNVFPDEAALRTAASIPSGCIIQEV